ncbi:peptide deformylase [Tistrella mobilis]|uniref:peptide deformylase n=1 Tax=Tistrella mobilis TaxID=171437 RepID=UPI0035590361
MAIMPILTAPDPRLTKTATPVARVDDDVRRLMDDMLETMYAAEGIGLAAPQVGVLQRVIVIDVCWGREGKEPTPLFMANPEIVWVSDEDKTYEEGCLSLPSHYADVVRPAAVRVRYLDRDGAVQEIEDDGLLAVCVQHEIDHLDGVLFVDHLSSIKRNMILRKLLKARRLGNDKPEKTKPEKTPATAAV